ncbi:MAG: hypothetical protein ACE5F9_14740 [Phycisphaerae bacterium]
MPIQTQTAGPDLAEALRTVAVNSAYNASRALSKWFKRGVRLTSDGFETISLTELSEAAGSPDDPIVAVRMPLEGDVTGDVLLAFPEKVALSLVDILMGQPDGTAKEVTELECSCLQETGNIVASAFTNCLSTWLKLNVVPAAPTVVYDLACAIIQPLLVGQAALGDDALISRTEFELDQNHMDWRLILLPSAESLKTMQCQCETDQVRQNALHTIAINGAFDASRAMSKWLRRGVRLSTEGFVRVPLREAATPQKEQTEPIVALRMDLGNQLHGHALLAIPMSTALELVDILIGNEPGTTKELDDMTRSCLEETGNIISGAFVNSWARWLDIHSEPSAPLLLIDMHEAIFQSVLVEQAKVSDEVFMAKAVFSIDGRWLDWEFYLLPTPSSLRLIETSWS